MLEGLDCYNPLMGLRYITAIQIYAINMRVTSNCVLISYMRSGNTDAIGLRKFAAQSCSKPNSSKFLAEGNPTYKHLVVILVKESLKFITSYRSVFQPQCLYIVILYWHTIYSSNSRPTFFIDSMYVI